MTKAAVTTTVVVSLGAICAGCASAPMQTANAGASATYHAAGVSAYAVSTTGTEIYHGAGRAIKAPLHDLNMMQDQIPPVLLRAEDKPYEVSDLDSCNDVLNKVAELDLALGPDVDMPKEEKRRTRASRGADFAADAALDAAGSAVEHFIPMRGTIKQISGATRYENHVKHAILSGEVRRSFLKTVGMAHNCTWPAAPLEFKPAQVADASASWAGKPMLATASTSAIPSAAIQTASLTISSAPAKKGLGHKSAIASEDPMAEPPLVVASYSTLVLPPVTAPAVEASETWRPPTSGIRTVSTPVTASAAAPWSSAFASSLAH
ncbi:MAG: hypothetical protein WA840_06185 [Caulobacteraceae bacterium]